MPMRRRKQKPSPRPGENVYHVETEVTRHQALPGGFTWKWKTYTSREAAERELNRLRAAGEAGTFSQVRPGKYIVMRAQRPPRIQALRKHSTQGLSSKAQIEEYRAFLSGLKQEQKEHYYQCAKCGRPIKLLRNQKIYLSPSGQRFHWSCRPAGVLRG